MDFITTDLGVLQQQPSAHIAQLFLFFGLFITMGLGRFNALLPCQSRRRTIFQAQLRLAEKLPSRRILRIKLDALLQMLRRLGVFLNVQITLAQAKSQ